MNDPYLYEKSSVLHNLLNIYNSKDLDVAEAELSQASMMLLYEQGFNDFSTQGIKTIHKVLFEDVYDWAGEFRVINIQKREPLLAGISVWYADSDNIKKDLDFDKELLAASAGYVRNAFVMASLGQYAEYEHLEKILLDAICTEPIKYTDDLDQEESIPQGEKYQNYKTDYKPVAHEYRADDEENKE